MVLIVFTIAVAAPLIAEIPLGFRVPVMVLETVLGIVIGPHVLGLAQHEGILATMGTYGMAASLFMAGMDLDFDRVRGRPLSLAASGWAFSLALGFAVVGILYAIPIVHAPIMVMLALSTTALGSLLPVLRDVGRLDTRFGHLFLAAGTVGELGPIVLMSLWLSRQYTTWQEIGLLLGFLAIVFLATAIGLRVRPAKVVALLGRTMHSSTQLPVRLSLLLLAAFFVLAEEFGLEHILGSLAAGMVVGLASRGEAGKPFREKIEAVCYGWFFPFFFVGTGIKFDLAALLQSTRTMLLVPAFLVLFLFVRGTPVLLYRNDLVQEARLPFALFTAVPSLSLVIVVTELGVRAGSIGSDIAAALVGAAVLSVLLFPTLAGFLLS